MDDETLARRSAQRDPEAWEELLRRAGPAALGMIRRVFRRAGLPSADLEAEDAMGAWSAALLEKDGKVLLAYRPPTPLSAYLAIVARGVAHGILRRRRGVRLADPSALKSPEPFEPQVSREALSRALDELEPRERLALQLVYWDGLAYDAVARVLAVQPSSVGPLVSRSRQALKEILGKSEKV